MQSHTSPDSYSRYDEEDDDEEDDGEKYYYSPQIPTLMWLYL